MTVFTWTFSLAVPADGLDPSWVTALALAFRHLQFGPHFIFTYGPLGVAAGGVLESGRSGFLSLLYTAVVTTLSAGLLVRLLRRRLPLWVAISITWVVVVILTSLVDNGDLVLAPAILLALTALRAESARTYRVALGALGLLGGVALLVKFNGGVIALAFGLVLVAACDRRARTLALFLGLYLVAMIVGWLAAKQKLSDISSYLHGSISSVIGYPAAMNISDPSRGSENWDALFMLVVLALALYLYTRRDGPLIRTAAVLLVVGWVWGAFKEGFVRHDGHDLIFFGLMVVLAAVLITEHSKLPGFVCQVGIVVIVALVATGATPENMASPITRSKQFAHEVNEVFNGAERTKVLTQARFALQAGPDHLTPSALAAVQGRSVAIEPTENSLVWAYPQLVWDPTPVIQEYAAYSRYLDHLDAAFLSSAQAPDRIVTQVGAIDGRYPYFDPPSTEVAMICHYDMLVTTTTWQVLGRGSNRCGASSLLGRRTVSTGQEVQVPKGPRGDMVVATFSINEPLLARLEGLVLKPPPLYVDLDLSGRTTSYRFIAGTAGDLHVLSTPSSLGYSPSLTPPSVSRLSLRGGGWSTGSGTVGVTFLSIPLKLASH